VARWGRLSEMKGKGTHAGLMVLSLSRRHGVTEVDSQWGVGATRWSGMGVGD